MKIKELRHGVQAVISTGPYENQRESFDVLATIKEDENPDTCMKILEDFNHRRLDMAVNKAKINLIEQQYLNIRFREKDGKKYPSVTSILDFDKDWYITQDELAQYAARGNIIHHLVYEYLKTGKWVEPLNVPELKEDISIVMSGSLGLNWKDCSHREFFEKHRQKMTVWSHEQVVFNKEQFYCGQYDIEGLWDGAPAILDIKSGVGQLPQLAAYAVCLKDIQRLVILKVGKTDNKCGYMKPVITDDIQGEFKKFLIERKKFRERFGV